MYDTKRVPDRARLFRMASEQGGHFTAGQALACGYSRALLSHHARGGELVRVHRGVYRFRDYPSHPRADVIAAWLAVGRETSVVSHESALDLLDLSDIVPGAIHITVPRRRRGYRPPAGVALHTTTRPFREGDLIVREGMRVTGPVRSILDTAAAGAAPEQIRRAARQAVERGMTTSREFVEEARQRGSRVVDLIADVVDGTDEG